MTIALDAITKTTADAAEVTDLCTLAMLVGSPAEDDVCNDSTGHKSLPLQR